MSRMALLAVDQRMKGTEEKLDKKKSPILKVQWTKKFWKHYIGKGYLYMTWAINMMTVDVGWGSSAFHKMGREKVFLINALLPFGYELLVCNTDMAWLKVVGD